MTTVEAVKKVLNDMEENKPLAGFQIHKRVVKELRKNGEKKRPLDSTVLRRLRENAGTYHIKTIGGKSLYVKTRQPHLFTERDFEKL